MLGQMQAAPQQQQQGQGMAAPEAQQQPMTDGGAATPEEQAIYDQVVNNAKEMIYPPNGGVAPAIRAGLEGQFDDQVMQLFAEAEPPLQGNPIDNLAATAAALVLFLDASANEAGSDIPDDVLFHAGVEIIEDLAELAEAAKIHDYQEKDMEGAFYRALDLFRVSSPRIDPEALKAQFAEVVEADKSGNLGALLPGVKPEAEAM